MTAAFPLASALPTVLHPAQFLGTVVATTVGTARFGAPWTPSDLLDDPGFRQGIQAGLLALVIVIAVATLVPRPPRWRGCVLPLAGIATAVATLVALDRTGPRALMSHQLRVGLVLLLVGPFAVVWALARWHGAWWVALAGALAAIPGAVGVGRAAELQNHTAGMPTLVVVSTVVGGLLVADFDDATARAGLSPVLFAVAVLGMYATLPDTEQTSVLVGVTLPLAFVGWPAARARLGPGAYAAVGLVGWVAAVGGRGRPGSVVGAIACLGVMLGEPLARRLWRGAARVPRHPLAWRTVFLVLLQFGVVMVASRVAGLETSARAAGALSLVALGLAVAGSAIVLAPWDRDKPADSSATRQRQREFNS